MADIDVDALRVVAHRAAELWDGYTHIIDERIVCRADGEVAVVPSGWEVAADHIAAFDPPTVLRLLDEIERMRAKVRAVEAWVDGPDRYVLRKLRAAIA